jgi:hypothetical protein
MNINTLVVLFKNSNFYALLYASHEIKKNGGFLNGFSKNDENGDNMTEGNSK